MKYVIKYIYTRSMKNLSVLKQRKLDHTLELLSLSTNDILSAPQLIQALRTRLGMSQTQLAKRVGIDQAHLARIEGGKLDVHLSTLRKILRALFSDLAILAKPSHPIAEIIRAQAAKVARSRVQHVLGTMALEKQEPDTVTAERMVQEETERLIQNPSKGLWDE